MALINRHGNFNKFDGNKLLSGEEAFTDDTAQGFVKCGNTVKEFAFKDDVADMISAAPEEMAALQEIIALMGEEPVATQLLDDVAALETNKVDNDGQGNNITVAFTEAEGYIQSGNSLTVMFGIIGKTLSSLTITDAELTELYNLLGLS